MKCHVILDGAVEVNSVMLRKCARERAGELLTRENVPMTGVRNMTWSGETPKTQTREILVPNR